MPTERLCGLKTGKILLKRGAIGADKGIDMTVVGSKGWTRALVPTHHMARSYKNGRVGRHTVCRQFRSVLDEAPMIAWKQLRDAGKDKGEVVLVCNCYFPGDYCHVLELIAYAVRRWPHAFRSE